MFNLYLHNNSFLRTAVEEIENSLKELNSIIVESDELDSFWKHDSIYDIYIDNEQTFSDIIFNQINDKQFSYQVLPKLLDRIKSTDQNYESIEHFDNNFVIFNAFYGVAFSTKNDRYLTCSGDYFAFRNKCIQEGLSPEYFSEITESFLNNLIFSESAIQQVSELKDLDLFLVIMSYLLNINKSVGDSWERGFYDYKEANKKYPLRMSLESESTMKNKKLKKMRIFSFHDKERCCELHAKINRKKIRIHILPDTIPNTSGDGLMNVIYVGYIGGHLETSNS
jgi:hypothetical protein